MGGGVGGSAVVWRDREEGVLVTDDFFVLRRVSFMWRVKGGDVCIIRGG